VTPEDARKLIGGYATGNLGDEERKALFAAALSEQELFDELVKEQALKELLDDPHARRRLLDQLRPAPQRNASWRWAAAGSLALATVMIAVVMMRMPQRPNAAPVQMATRLPAPPAPPLAPPVTPPAPSLRDSVRAMPLQAAPQAQNRIAPAPIAAPSAQVDAVAKSKETAARAGGVIGGIVGGLPYRILRRDANGTFAEAPADSVFDGGDAVRVRVDPPAAGILSLSVGGELLASIRVEANQVYVLPVDRPITLDGAAGETRLSLSLSPRDGQRDMRQKKAEALSARPAVVPAQARAALSVEIVLRHR
jgi:hypothetical protein